MNWNRETVAIAVVGTGSAWMLGSALFNYGKRGFNAMQRRGLLLSGCGFLLCAISARWLQGFGMTGIACSIGGTMLAMAGMYQLVKERAARRSAEESEGRK